MENDKIELGGNEIEITGELDPEFHISTCYATASNNAGVSLKVEISCLPDLKDVTSLLQWGNDHEIGQWKGKWRLTLERIKV